MRKCVVGPLPDTFVDAAGTWVWVGLVRDGDEEWAFPVSRRTLIDWRTKGCPALGGKPLRAETRYGTLKGQGMGRVYVRSEDLKRVREFHRNEPAEPAGWISRPEAEGRVGRVLLRRYSEARGNMRTRPNHGLPRARSPDSHEAQEGATARSRRRGTVVLGRRPRHD